MKLKMQTPTYIGYRIKLVIAVEKNCKFETKNEIMIPSVYSQLNEARKDVINDIKERLSETLYFRSQKLGYQLVRYGKDCKVNTYLTYRIVPIKSEAFIQ